VFIKLKKWYLKHEKVQWLVILVPLWLQPIHMYGMHEITLHSHGLVKLEELPFHLTHWNMWVDLFLLSIDHMEWISIVGATEKFIRWWRRKKIFATD
jgi:hypothetical protein